MASVGTRLLVSTGPRVLHNPQTCALALHHGSCVETGLVLQSATEKDDSVVASEDATLGLSPSPPAYPCDLGKPFSLLVPQFPYLLSSLITVLAHGVVFKFTG